MIFRLLAARMTKLGITAGTVAALALGSLSVPPAAAAPTGIGLNPPSWTADYESATKYPRVAVQWDVPVTMSDGTVLKANVFRPADARGRAVDIKTPTLVNLTPYTKLVSTLATVALNVPVLSPALIALLNQLNFSDTPIAGVNDLLGIINGGLLSNFTVDPVLVKNGYTQVVVDVRGTGFSQGVWQVLGNREQQDTAEVLTWARSQRWSNGKLGMVGVSYSAINQLQVAAQRPPGLDALFPVVPSADLTNDVLAPGGGFGVGFLSYWLALVNILKFVPDVQSLLNGTFDAKWLQSRLQNPAVYIPDVINGIFEPDSQNWTPVVRSLLSATSERRQSLLTSLAEITTPTFAIGGFNDLFARTETQLLDSLSALPNGKKKVVIGDGFHLTTTHDMGGPGEPPSSKVLQKAWFDHWLKGVANGIEGYAPATVHRLGSGWWQGDQFPARGQIYRRLYLSGVPSGTARAALSDGSLWADRPRRATTKTVAPGLSTVCSNDTNYSLIGVLVFPACSPDNRIAETNALTFTTKPATAGTTISGAINVHLLTRYDATDGYWSVTLSDVAPDGRSSVISSGQLTVSLRKIDDARSRRAPTGDLVAPQYTLDIGDRELVRPGQLVALDIASGTTDAYLAPGHRLRVSLFALNFPKSITLGVVTAASKLRPEHLVIDPRNPSYVVIPSDRPWG